jgi:hypothetical protein
MGKATQWLPNADDDLVSLNRSKMPSQEVDELTILSAKQGDVLLLKGDAWPKNDGKGAIHRSPPSSLSQRRVLLTLDPL